MDRDVATGKNIRKQTPVPGLAPASPIVQGDRVYVATAVKPGTSGLEVGLHGDIGSAKETEPHPWRLMALDKNTGQIEWDTVGHEGVLKVERHIKASHRRPPPADGWTDGRMDGTVMSTPAIADKMLFYRTRDRLVAIGTR